jgi:hypothetical protein
MKKIHAILFCKFLYHLFMKDGYNIELNNQNETNSLI